MNVDQAVDLGRDAIMITLLVGAPVMIVAAAVGLLISIFQAVTQIQDQTISFAPKIVCMMLVMLYILPWAMGQVLEYATDLVRDIPSTL